MDSGHGTHVTRTIVGFNYNDLYWIKGVAPAVEIIPKPAPDVLVI